MVMIRLGYPFKNKILIIRALPRKYVVEKNQANRDFGHQGTLWTTPIRGDN